MNFIIAVSFFLLIGWVVKVISDNKTRRKALETGNLNESIRHLWEKYYENKPVQNVKWAIILIILGAFILIGEIVTLNDATIFATSLIAVGLFLLAYYWKTKD